MRNFWCQYDQIFTNIFELYQVFVAKGSNITDALKASYLSNCSVKLVLFLFFSSSDMKKFHHLGGCYATSVNSLFNYFLSTLRFSDLLCQAKSLTIFLQIDKRSCPD